MAAYRYGFFYFLAIAWLSPGTTSAIDRAENGVIGAVFDCNGRAGKEQMVAMEMAVEEFNSREHQQLILSINCSRDPDEAAQAARHLIDKDSVDIIIGPKSWEQSAALAKAAEPFHVPILSLSDTVPPWATARWPNFVQASPDMSDQIQAVAAIIESWQWRTVNVIYEDSGLAANRLLKDLYLAFQNSGVQISSLVALPYFASSETLYEELMQLKSGQSRVFLVHASLSLAERVFRNADKMRMMEDGYVWITMDSALSLIHSMNASVISSMQGVVGVRRYFSDTGQDFDSFNTKFMMRFHQKYPKERNHEPGIFALQAYDVTCAAGSGINAGSKNGQTILDGIVKTDMDGLSGKIKFEGRKLTPINQFEIINVYGNSYKLLGFWLAGRGFSKGIDGKEEYNSSMASLGHVIWPGGSSDTPKGSLLATSRPLSIGVPIRSVTDAFVKVDGNLSTGNYNFSGYCIEIFERTVRNMNNPFNYQFRYHNGSYTDLVKKVHAKEFDAAVGDIAIISERYKYVEFTHPHTEGGLVMVVETRSHDQALLFLKPFTKNMWLIIVFICLYNGIAICYIEHEYCPELRSEPKLQKIGTFLWLAFGRNGETLRSSLSRMAAMMWILTTLIIAQSYAASFSSILTVQQLEPKIKDIETLRKMGADVGCSNMSFVRDYLTSTLGFDWKKIKTFSKLHEYHDAFSNGTIRAAFLEIPVARLLIAEHCKTYTISGFPQKVGGYGFAFPKGSPLIPEVNEELLKLFETGKLKDLEERFIESQKCIDEERSNSSASLSPRNFAALFILSCGTTTVALVICYLRKKVLLNQSMVDQRGILLLIYTVQKKWKYSWSRLSRKVSDVECPPNDAISTTTEGHGRIDS